MMFSILKVLGFSVILSVLGYFGYYYYNLETKRDMTEFMYELSKSSTSKFAKEMPRVQNIEKLLVLPVIGGRDEDTLLQEMLIDKVSNSRKYSVSTWLDLKNNLGNGTIWQQVVSQAGFIQNNMPTSKKEAEKALKILSTANITMDGVLIVKCFYQEEDEILGSVVKLTGNIYKFSNNKLEKQKDTIESESSISSRWDHLFLTYEIQSYGLLRVVLWICFSILPIWALYPLGYKITQYKKNSLIALYLSFFVFVGVASSWIFLFAFPQLSFTMLLVHIVMSFALFKVNYDALDFLERKA